jgi:hypothetical protein
MNEPFEGEETQLLKLYLYLVPIVGFFPALYTLYRHAGTQQERNLCRQVVLLSFIWLSGYVGLSAASTSESLHLPLLIANSLLTSGYFLTNFLLMVRLWQRKSLRLPGIDRLSQRQHD